MTKTNLSTTTPLECDLPIIHLLDVRRFSREGMNVFVKSFDGNGIGMFFFPRRVFFLIKILMPKWRSSIRVINQIWL